MAESIAKSATGIDARVPAETEADSVAVAVKEAGTNRTKEQSFNPRGCFFCGNEKPRRGHSDEQRWRGLQ